MPLLGALRALLKKSPCGLEEKQASLTGCLATRPWKLTSWEVRPESTLPDFQSPFSLIHTKCICAPETQQKITYEPEPIVHSWKVYGYFLFTKTFSHSWHHNFKWASVSENNLWCKFQAIIKKKKISPSGVLVPFCYEGHQYPYSIFNQTSWWQALLLLTDTTLCLISNQRDRRSNKASVHGCFSSRRLETEGYTCRVLGDQQRFVVR